MTYSENLQARAEEMAKEMWPKNFDKFSEEVKKKMCKPLMRLAALCLQKEAEAFREGYFDYFWKDANNIITCNKKLQSLG